MIEKYPGWRYHPQHKAVIVRSLLEEQEKCAGEGWAETPYEPPVAPKWEVKATVEPPAPVDPNEPKAADEDERARLEQRAALFHALAPKDAIEKVRGIQTVADLAEARDLEGMHPKAKGGRRAVIRAINDRMHQLLGGEAE